MRRGQVKRTAFGALACLFALSGIVACDADRPRDAPRPDRAILRLGISNVPALATERGVQQFILNLSSEGLLRVNQEGRLEPWLAEGWDRSPDGLRLTIRLRHGVTFQDGSPADAGTISQLLNEQLGKFLKSAADDVESIGVAGEREILIRFKRPSSLFADALMDVQIVKPGTASPSPATGAFMAASNAKTNGPQMVAYDQYYLGKPALGGVRISTYPNVRAAWADMLRGQLDMLYEVDSDAIDMMRGATNVSMYAFDRPYQYLVFLNTRSPKLRSPAIRQALNQAVDRATLVRDALGGHGAPSAGPVSPKHWAFGAAEPTFSYAPQSAAAKIWKPFTLTMVTLAGAPFDKLALSMKQQVKQVGVDLQIKEAPLEQAFAMLSQDNVEAALVDSTSGWSLIRAYRWWHSKGSSNVSRFSDPSVDAALDRVNRALTDDEYRAGVRAFQKAIAENPPAVFLAWSDRSRAISTRFDVQTQPARDILSTLRLWRPSTEKPNATRN